jgi:hypothetical protein
MPALVQAGRCPGCRDRRRLGKLEALDLGGNLLGVLQSKRDGVFVLECRDPTAPARPGHQFIDVEQLEMGQVGLGVCRYDPADPDPGREPRPSRR